VENADNFTGLAFGFGGHFAMALLFATRDVSCGEIFAFAHDVQRIGQGHREALFALEPECCLSESSVNFVAVVGTG
jgi:hypothetical protein